MAARKGRPNSCHLIFIIKAVNTIIDQSQTVEIKWITRTRKFYESLGYTFTSYSDLFQVKITDLPTNSSHRVEVACDCCGKKQLTPYRNYNKIIAKSGEYRCRKCNAPHTSQTRILNNSEQKIKEFVKLVDSIGCKTFVTVGDYNGYSSPMPIVCPKHGEQMISLEQLKVGCICPMCGRSNKGKVFMLSPSQVESAISKRNGATLLNPEEYAGCNVKNLRIKCGTCGDVFVTNYTSAMISTCRCERCRRGTSEGELRIKEFLDENNIVYDRQKQFPDCKNIRPLPFDFYLEQYNCCIEFDGIQHYKQTSRQTYDDFRKRKMLDGIKDDFCAKNSIKLIRIPYFEYNNIEQILRKELNLWYELEDIV